MADNIALHNDDATLVGTLATDDIGGIQYGRTKIVLGADGVNDGDVSSANPMPVKGTGTAGTPNAGVVTVQGIASMTALVVDGSGVTQPVSGTVTANAGTGTFTVDQANAAEADYDTGAGTVNQVMMGIALPGAGGPVAGGTATAPIRTDPTGTTTQPVSGSVSITGAVDTELPAAASLADDTANPAVPAVGSFQMVFDGTNWDRLRGTSADGLLVNLGANNDVTVTGAVDTELPAAEGLSDAFANPTTPPVGGCTLIFNGTTWDRARGDITNGLDVDVTRLPSIPAGTNNIGDVDVLTQPARAATTDAITAKLATDSIQNGLTALTPKFASIDVATLGDNTIVAAVPSKKIRVLAYALVCGAATTVIWKSATAGAISGDMQFAANGGIAAPFSPIGHFETTAGEALVLNLSAANAVSGHLVYVEV